jgi:hypothetical protein
MDNYTLRDIVQCRWDEEGKVWFQGVIKKFSRRGKKKQAFICFDDSEERWFHIRKGWMRIEQKADSEEEEYEASDDADSSVDSSENETKSAKQSATSKSPAASKGKRVRKSTMLRVYFLINRYKTIVLMLCRRERADK